MEKKRILAAAAAVSILACCTSCGDSDGSGAKDNLTGGNPITGKSTVLDGDYATVTGLHSPTNIFDNGIDNGLLYAIQDYKSNALTSLSFESGSFRMLGNLVNKEYAVYSGTYTLSDGKIIFNYTDYSCEDLAVNLNEAVPEPDNDIITKNRHAAAVKDLPKDEQTERIRAEQLLLTKKKLQEKMAEFNETGTYWNKVEPKLLLSDKASLPNALPMYSARFSGIQKRTGTPYMLCPMDGLICVETFGMKLEGGYSIGRDFTVSFDLLAPLYDDEYSNYNLEPDSRKRYDERYQTYLERYFAESRNTTISFSNGKWTWTNADGELINNGTYLESTEHSGLIGMFVNESSKVNDKTYQQLSPLLFYIDGDGNIWYPNWVKMN